MCTKESLASALHCSNLYRKDFVKILRQYKWASVETGFNAPGTFSSSLPWLHSGQLYRPTPAFESRCKRKWVLLIIAATSVEVVDGRDQVSRQQRSKLNCLSVCGWSLTDLQSTHEGELEKDLTASSTYIQLQSFEIRDRIPGFETNA
eukprot:3354966-Rhodomonas_salina.1